MVSWQAECASSSIEVQGMPKGQCRESQGVVRDDVELVTGVVDGIFSAISGELAGVFGVLQGISNFAASSWPPRAYRQQFNDFSNFAMQIRGCNLRAMSNHESESPKAGTFPWKENASLAEQANAKPATKAKKAYSDMQSAIRFPVKLPISVKSKSGERHTETQNISANGVLFQVVDAEMPVGSTVDFTISLPAEIVGAETDVRLDCKGRVVRNFEDAGRHGVGVVIDEYHFDRH